MTNKVYFDKIKELESYMHHKLNTKMDDIMKNLEEQGFKREDIINTMFAFASIEKKGKDDE